jgi:hypothetical protein
MRQSAALPAFILQRRTRFPAYALGVYAARLPAGLTSEQASYGLAKRRTSGCGRCPDQTKANAYPAVMKLTTSKNKNTANAAQEH